MSLRPPLSERIAYVALACTDPDAAAQVFERHFELPRRDFGSVALFPLGQSALALFPLDHPLLGADARPGVHHIALGLPAFEAARPFFDGAAIAGLDGRKAQWLARDQLAGVRVLLTEPLDLGPAGAGLVTKIDHIGVASTDVREDEAIFCGRLGFALESRQTDMEVAQAIESFTSDKYGVVYHARPPEPVGGLRVTFITVGDCELEFLANFDPRQGGEVRRGEAGNTRQDQGAITRFVASRGRGLHHVAVKSPDINRLLGSMAAAGVPMIDTRGRPGSRRALIGFPHPKALGGVLMHVVQRPD